jgi:AraC-like DNA-binding protein
MRATIAARLVRFMMMDDRILRATERTLERYGLTLEDMSLPEARIDHEMLVEIIEIALEVTQDPELGLHGALLLGTNIFHVVDYLGRTASTVLEALEKVADYTRLLHDGFHIRLRRQNSQGILELSFDEGLRYPPALMEFSMACLFLAGYRMGLPRFESQVFFEHPAPSNLKTYAQVFRVPVHFNAPGNYALLPPSVFEVRMPEANPELCAVMESHAQGLMERFPQTSAVTEQTRRLIAAELRAGSPTLLRVAEQLHLSPRTLRRRLLEDGTTFHRLLDELRRDLTLERLARQNFETEETALALGFSDASAFRRAFKRWTGQSLSDHRRLRDAAGGSEPPSSRPPDK